MMLPKRRLMLTVFPVHLQAMGFSEVACRQALIQANNDIDKALDILMLQQSNDTLPRAGANQSGSSRAADPWSSSANAAPRKPSDDLLGFGSMSLNDPTPSAQPRMCDADAGVRLPQHCSRAPTCATRTR